MKVLSDKKTFDINKFNKNLLEEYINTYSNINPNNSNYDLKNTDEKLLIYVLTFNMNGLIPSKDELPLLFPKKEKFENFDIFVINTQECLRSIGASLFNNSKEEWEKTLSNFFGFKYENIANLTLGALHMVIFIKKEKVIFLSDIRTGEIATGFLNIFANKGAISASMKYFDKHILFICCHLTAGQEKGKERNEELKRIGTSLINSIDSKSRNKLRTIRKSVISENFKINNFNSFKNSKTILSNLNKDNNNKNGSNKKNKRNSMCFIEPKNIFNNRIEEVYNDNDDEEDNKNQNSDDEEEDEKRKEKENERLNSTNKNNKEEEINKNNNDNNNYYNENKSFSSTLNEKDKKDKLIEDYDFVILSGDLNYRLNINKNEINDIMNKNDPEILWDKDQFTEEVKNKQNFKEGVINFMPTYKFKKNSNEYDYSRIPGWTDRILYKSKRYYDIMLCEYSSIKNIIFSDHKPVYAVFKINFKDQKFISHNFHKNDQECYIY